MNRLISTISCALLFSGAWAQEIFHTIALHHPDGSVSTFPIEQVESITFSQEPSVQRNKWFHSLENPGIADYLRDFDYDPADYSYHRIFSFRGEPYLDARQDWPYGVTLGDTTYYNLIPGRTYSLQPLSHGQLEPAISIQTLGQLRMIRAEGIDNVRDLGGWHTADGRRIRYGLLFRGTELNTSLSPTLSTLRSPHQVSRADIRMLRDELGIQAELDLRSNSECPIESSALGQDIHYFHQSIDYREISSSTNRTALANCFRYILSEIQGGHPVYIHCIWGADRTGVLCFLIEGLLGVSQSDLDKDYEITSFSGNTRYRTNTQYQANLRTILSLPGEDLASRFRTWWLQSGISDEELDLFCSLLKE